MTVKRNLSFAVAEEKGGGGGGRPSDLARLERMVFL